MSLTFNQFKSQVEKISGFTDWKYYDGGDNFPYYRAYRNNDQFEIIYCPSEYRYDWECKRNFATTRVARDCYTLQDAIAFLKMPRPVQPKPDRRPPVRDLRFAHSLGYLCVGAAIGWVAALTTQLTPVSIQQSNFAPSSSTEAIVR